jgi:hypothetical protein
VHIYTYQRYNRDGKDPKGMGPVFCACLSMDSVDRVSTTWTRFRWILSVDRFTPKNYGLLMDLSFTPRAGKGSDRCSSCRFHPAMCLNKIAQPICAYENYNILNSVVRHSLSNFWRKFPSKFQ